MVVANAVNKQEKQYNCPTGAGKYGGVHVWIPIGLEEQQHDEGGEIEVNKVFAKPGRPVG